MNAESKARRKLKKTAGKSAKRLKPRRGKARFITRAEARRRATALPAETGSRRASNPRKRPRPWEEKFADGSGIVHLPDGSMSCIEARPDRVPVLPRPGAPVSYNDPPPPPPVSKS